MADSVVNPGEHKIDMVDCAKIIDGGGLLFHNSGTSLVWTAQELSILEDLLTRYGKDTIIVQYAKIAKALPDKTIRDVAFCCRWMSDQHGDREYKINMADCAGGNEDAKINDGGGLLSHNLSTSLGWTAPEQFILEDLMTRYSKDTIVVQYAKIAKALPNKTIRDVAFCCRWMSEKIVKQKKKEVAKQRKDDRNSPVMNKEEKEYAADSMLTSSQVTNGNNVTNVNNSMMMGCDDKISYETIGGACGKLLEQNVQNVQAFDQISANFSDSKQQFHAEKMQQMPPLPAQLNEELPTTIFCDSVATTCEK